MSPSAEPTTSIPTTSNPTNSPTAPSNKLGGDLCDAGSWEIIKGNWTYDGSDCSLENTDSGAGNIVWFGSDHGLTPDDAFVHESFLLTVTMEVHSGQDSGVIFRTEESSTTNNEGPTYYVGLYPASDTVKFGTMDDGWSTEHSASVALEYDTMYTLAIMGSRDLYTVYLDGEAVLENIDGEQGFVGSIGLRTFLAPTTYHTLSYLELSLEEECNGLLPTKAPTPSPTLKPTAEPTTVPTTAPTTGSHYIAAGKYTLDLWDDEYLFECMDDYSNLANHELSTDPAVHVCTLAEGDTRNIGVSCCELDGSGGERDANGLDCHSPSTYDEAVQYCESAGYRLCTLTEMLSLATSNTGCGFDCRYNWVSDECAL